MARLASMSRTHMAVVLTAALSAFSFALNPSIAQQEDRPAFVIVERVATTGDMPSWLVKSCPNTALDIWRAVSAIRCSKATARHPVAWPFCSSPA
jgi:hypothetical protein